MSAALEELLEKIHAAALVRGEAWLREKVAEIIAEEGSQDPPPCAKRGRAYERRSPSPVPRNRPKLSSKDPPEVSGGPCPASEGPCPAENPFSLGSDSRDGDKGLRIQINAASRCGSDNGQSSEVAGTVSAEDQRSSDDDGGQKQSTPSPNQSTVKAKTRDNTSPGKAPDTTHSRKTEEETIVLRIERLLQSCTAAIELQQEQDESSEPTLTPASSSVPGRPPYLVWIFGNSFVTSALEKVSLVPDGRQLGFPLSEATIRWLGFKDLTWDSVIPKVVHYSRLDRPPDILVIHAGGDDIYSGVCAMDLTKNIKRDLWKLLCFFTRVDIVWSNIVRRPRCPEGTKRKILNRVCRNANNQLLKSLGFYGAGVVHHKGLEGEDFHFEEDGSCLNSVGNDIWCSGIKRGIRKALRRWHCRSTPNQAMEANSQG
ncbi:uncharacterized protein ACNLHF_000921 [Anomaloglossus baeobatrachus]|uniref:uncharacterized protein LOC142250814 n=1 Tax=Anomaloglossus baeobatrachus TaxID=238106 RepID=UPI003F4F89C5